MSKGSIELEGIDDFVSFVEDMEITDEAVGIAIRKAMNNIKRYVEPKAPNKTGRTKKSIKVKIKKSDFGTVGVLYVGSWSAMFQEYRNNKQRGLYVGWFERGVRESGDEFARMLKKELLK